jgi:putative ABC transport system permease protein
MAIVSPAYFTTMQIPIVAGRAFTDAELSAAETVGQPIVVSEMLAHALWPSEPAVGKQLDVGRLRHIVVGVAANTRAVSLAEVTPFLYLPAIAGHDTRLRIVVRGATSLVTLERFVPDWARALDPGIVADGERFTQRVKLELTPARITSGVAAAMGVLTMLLALVGIYGVVSFAVSQHTRDIAVRLALGDTQRGVVRLMMRQGSRPVIAGLVVGLVAALGLSQVIRGFLLGVSPLDPVAYLAMGGVLMLASLAAMYAPARHAASVNPALTLRDE